MAGDLRIIGNECGDFVVWEWEQTLKEDNDNSATVDLT